MTSEPESSSYADQLEFARNIALNLLEVRMRSTSELRQALARKNVPADIAEDLVERFTRVGLLNDAEFARAFVATREKVNRHGVVRIRQDLRAKGIDDELAQAVLAELDPDSQVEAARTFASKKMRSLARVDQATATRRLYGALARRGFPSSLVAQVVRETLATDVDLGEG